MTYKIGLTGLIGSGKSLVSGYFADLGITVVDADIISHNLTSLGGVALPLIADIFGSDYIRPGGGLDRVKMRELVFKSPDWKVKLEQVMHPLIFAEVVSQVNKSNGLYTIIVVPLLFQSSRYLAYIQRSIFVDCNEDELIRRVIKRNNFERDMVLAILNSQIPRDQQLLLADDILYNVSTTANLQEQVELLHKKYSKQIINNNFIEDINLTTCEQLS